MSLLFESIQTQCVELCKRFDEISSERKVILEKLADYLSQKIKEENHAELIYVCTHNSRRSHMGQIWASVAAHFYGFKQITAFSAGTEVTAFHPNAKMAFQSLGFQIEATSENENPLYRVCFGENAEITCFSKRIDDEVNPIENFVAVMTCSDAETNCPFIPGASLRIGTTYDDPKLFDGTPLQQTKYLERINQIGCETLYVFSKIN